MIHAILYMGQSNVPGVEHTGAPSGLPEPAVRYWIRGLSGGITDVAWHDLEQWPDSSATFGPALAMGLTLQEFWEDKVAILQISRGGSYMWQWQPGEFFHNQATITINQARALLLAQFPGETDVYWHFVWQQGESEMLNADISYTNGWTAGFNTLKASWEALLGQQLEPVIILTNQNISGAVWPTQMRAAQLAADAAAFVDTNAAVTVDGLHNNSPSNNIFGAETANTLIELNPMTVTHGTATRTAVADTVVGQLDTGAGPGKILVRAGVTTLVTITLADPAFSAAVAGVATLLGTPLTAIGVADGQADNFLAQNSDGTTAFGGAVTATGDGGDMQLDDIDILDGETVTLTSGSYTAPP